jgi:transcriptional regulator of acetoin/glycerol metabolism
LFFRLNGHRLHLPPLRTRPREIGDLARWFASSEALQGVSIEALLLLRRHSWPGNVRELEMCVRSSAGACIDGWLGADAVRHRWLERNVPDLPAATLRDGRAQVERQMLERALEDYGGNVTAASRALGISRQAFYKARRRSGLA